MIRGIFGALLALALAFTLSGCFLADPKYDNRSKGKGTPVDVARAAWLDVPGVTSFDFDHVFAKEIGTFGGGVKEQMHTVARVRIDAEHHIVDQERFVKALANTAWAVDDGTSPMGRALLIVGGGVDPNAAWDLTGLSELGTIDASGSTSVAGVEVAPDEVVVTVHDAKLQSTFGRWPGRFEDVPSDLVADGPPAELPKRRAIVSYDGVTRVRDGLTSHAPPGSVCYRPELTPEQNGRGERFPGRVTVELSQADTVIDSQTADFVGVAPAVCAGADVPLTELTLSISTTEAAGWESFHESGLPVFEAPAN